MTEKTTRLLSTANTIESVDYTHMSLRARAYVSVAAARAFLTAAVLLAMGHELGDKVYPTVTQVFTVTVWTHIWAAVGIVLVIGALTASIRLARFSLIAMATLTSIWAVGVTMTTLQNVDGGGLQALVVSPVLWWALVIKDLIVLRQPLVSPFEELVKSSNGKAARTGLVT